MKEDFTIREAQQSDAVALKELFQNTVLVINRRDYSQSEVEDWASCGDNLSEIEDMIKTHYFIVAVNQRSQIVGFSSITPQGYLHSMFVHKDFQGKGIATMLLEEIERYAITSGIMRITSEVSLTARPFFEKRGFFVVVVLKRKAFQIYLTNFWMVTVQFSERKRCHVNTTRSFSVIPSTISIWLFLCSPSLTGTEFTLSPLTTHT